MYFKMMKILAVCVWLVKSSVFTAAFAYLLAVSQLFLPLPSPLSCPYLPKQTRDGKQQYNQALWNYL